MRTEDLIRGLTDLLADIERVPDLQSEALACRVLLKFLEGSIE